MFFMLVQLLKNIIITTNTIKFWSPNKAVLIHQETFLHRPKREADSCTTNRLAQDAVWINTS